MGSTCLELWTSTRKPPTWHSEGHPTPSNVAISSSVTTNHRRFSVLSFRCRRTFPRGLGSRSAAVVSPRGDCAGELGASAGRNCAAGHDSIAEISSRVDLRSRADRLDEIREAFPKIGQELAAYAEPRSSVTTGPALVSPKDLPRFRDRRLLRHRTSSVPSRSVGGGVSTATRRRGRRPADTVTSRVSSSSRAKPALSAARLDVVSDAGSPGHERVSRVPRSATIASWECGSGGVRRHEDALASVIEKRVGREVGQLRDATVAVYAVYASWARNTLTAGGVVFGLVATFIASVKAITTWETVWAVIALALLAVSIILSLWQSLEMATAAARVGIETDWKRYTRRRGTTTAHRTPLLDLVAAIVSFGAGVLAISVFAGCTCRLLVDRRTSRRETTAAMPNGGYRDDLVMSSSASKARRQEPDSSESRAFFPSGT